MLGNRSVSAIDGNHVHFSQCWWWWWWCDDDDDEIDDDGDGGGGDNAGACAQAAARVGIITAGQGRIHSWDVSITCLLTACLHLCPLWHALSVSLCLLLRSIDETDDRYKVNFFDCSSRAADSCICSWCSVGFCLSVCLSVCHKHWELSPQNGDSSQCLCSVVVLLNSLIETRLVWCCGVHRRALEEQRISVLLTPFVLKVSITCDFRFFWC